MNCDVIRGICRPIKRTAVRYHKFFFVLRDLALTLSDIFGYFLCAEVTTGSFKCMYLILTFEYFSQNMETF